MQPPDTARLPALVRRYVERALPSSHAVPSQVRVRQHGEMWRRPGAGPLRFEAVEDFDVRRTAFTWRARFPLVGPLALTVVDGFDGASGELRVSLLGCPLRTQRGPETDVGELMRYLAELAWAPHTIVANRELAWSEVGEREVEVSSTAATAQVSVRWRFDDAGDLVEATGVRPYPTGRDFVPKSWGGTFTDYVDFDGTRVPARGEAWWEPPEGRFVYWRGEVVALELLAD